MAGTNSTPGASLPEDDVALGQVLSQLGKTFLDGLREHAHENNVKVEGLPDDPKAAIPPEQIVTVLRSAAGVFFPGLVPTSTS